VSSDAQRKPLGEKPRVSAGNTQQSKADVGRRNEAQEAQKILE
jgi:hypothetical protein